MGGESDVNDGYEHDLPVLGSADGLTGTVGAPSPREKGRVSARPGSDASPTITAREGASWTPAVDDEAVGRGPTATRPPAPVIGGSRPNPRARHVTRENVC